jgi:Kef-type K+ transport system membrane component KefB
MSHDVLIIITLSVIIFISPYLSKIFRVPTTPIEIVLGSFASSLGFITFNHYFELIAEVGFFYLMFLAGTEVNLKELQNIPRKLMQKNVFYIMLLYFFSFIFAKIFNFSSIFIVILPLISVGLILTLYKEFDKDTKWLNLSMTTGIMGELVSIVAVTIAGSVLVHGVGIELYASLTYLILFLAVVAILFKGFKLLFWWYPELKTYLIPIYSDKDEKDIRLSMALFFLMIAVMLILDLEIAFGAFVAGMFIPTFFAHHKELPHKLSSFGFGFLIPIFFVYIGSTFKLSSLFIDGLIMKALLITFTMIAIRMLASWAFFGYLTLKERVLFAFSHSMPLTLLIAIVTLAYQNSSITQFYYFAFILASLFEVLISIVSIKIIAKKGCESLIKR